RADAYIFELRNRGGLLKILEYLRIVDDVLAIERKALLRERVHGCFPRRLETPAEAPVSEPVVRPCQCVERCRKHQLQVAFRQHHVAVFEAQYLALLGDAQLALKAVEGLRIDGAVRRSATASDRAAAAMKQP